MDKYKQYVDLQWWNEPQKRDIDNWIKNFGTDKEVAKIILDNVIYYNDAQLEVYTKFLNNKLKKQVYEQVMQEGNYAFVEDKALQSAWEEYKQKTRFIPAALRGDTTSSAFKAIRQWRGIVKSTEGEGEWKKFFPGIDDIEENYKSGARRFVLVDDFSGSGSQMLRVLRQKISFKNQDIELGKLPGYAEDVEIVVAVYVIHTRAIEVISAEYPKLKILFVDLISEDLNYLNEESIMYKKLEPGKAKAVIAEIRNLCDTVMKENAELQELSSYALNIPIVFEHGCPNNTLVLLFANTDNWQQLFKRGEET